MPASNAGCIERLSEGSEVRKISITLTIQDEAKTLLRMAVSNLIRYEPAQSGEVTLVVYTDAVDSVRTVLVRESPVEIARIVWAALKPYPHPYALHRQEHRSNTAV
jgi:hypothetical protein